MSNTTISHSMVSTDLLVKLLAWQREHDTNYSDSSGWRSEVARARWESAASELAEALADALGSSVKVDTRSRRCSCGCSCCG